MKKYMFKAETVRNSELEVKFFESQKEAEAHLNDHKEYELNDAFEKRLVLVEIEDGMETEIKLIDSCNYDYFYFLQIARNENVGKEGYLFQSKWFESKEELLDVFHSLVEYLDQKNYTATIMRAPYDKFSYYIGDIEVDGKLPYFKRQFLLEEEE